MISKEHRSGAGWYDFFVWTLVKVMVELFVTSMNTGIDRYRFDTIFQTQKEPKPRKYLEFKLFECMKSAAEFKYYYYSHKNDQHKAEQIAQAIPF